MALLEVRDVTLRFGGIVALDGVSFDVEEGHISGLIGPNGAGKTTAFNVITRLYKPDAGDVLLDGSSLLKAACVQDRAQGRRADVPEHPALPHDVGARERARRSARARAEGRRGRGARGARRRRPARPRAVSRRRRCRTGSRSASSSPARSWRSRACFSSTSRPAGSTTRRSPSSARSSRRSATTSSSPCSSSSTT